MTQDDDTGRAGADGSGTGPEPDTGHVDAGGGDGTEPAAPRPSHTSEPDAGEPDAGAPDAGAPDGAADPVEAPDLAGAVGAPGAADGDGHGDVTGENGGARDGRRRDGGPDHTSGVDLPADPDGAESTGTGWRPPRHLYRVPSSAVPRRDDQRDLRRHASALRAMEEVSCAPGQSSLLMEICIDRALEMTGATGAAIALLQEGELFYAATAGDLRGRLAGSQPVSHTLGGLSISTGRTLHTRDVLADPRVSRDLVAPLGTRSAIATPLMQSHRRFGVLWVSSPVPDAFDDWDVDTLSRLARVASARLEFAQVREERRRSEQALVDNQLQHAAVLAALDEGVMVMDGARRVQLVNAAAERILGVPRERLLASDAMGMPWGVVSEDGEQWDIVRQPLTASLRTEKGMRNTVMGVHRPDGARRWLSVTTVPIYNATGDVMRGVVASFTDVTDQREHLGRTDRAERLLDQVERLTCSGSWEWAAGSATATWSEGMYRLLGTSRGESDARLPTYLARVHPGERASVRRTVFAAIRDGRARNLEHLLMRDDGTRVRVRCSLEICHDEKGAVSAARGGVHAVGPDTTTDTVTGATADTTTAG